MARTRYVVIAVVGMGLIGGLAYVQQSGQLGPVLANLGWADPDVSSRSAARQAGGTTGSGAGPGAGPAAGGPRGGGPVAVEVGEVLSVTLSNDAQSVGTLKARRGVAVRPEVAGRIARLGFVDGQPVKRGQMLVQLDNALEAAEVQQAQAQLSIARASVNRNRELVAQKFVSQAALDESVANLEVAQARLQLAQARLQRMRIIAPFNGVAGIRQVSEGEFLAVGAHVVNVDDIAQLLLDFRLPERYLPGVRAGQITDVQVDALPGKKFVAHIEAVDPQVDVNGRSVLVRARLDNPQGDLRPGMFARVRAVFGERPGAVMVPEQAIVPQGGRQWVIQVIDQAPPEGASNGQAQPRRVSRRVEVTLGARSEGLVEVFGDVLPGQTVITAGQQRVPRDGMQLRVVRIDGSGS